MHGGRWAITGFLYQMLGSLGHVGRIAASDAQFTGDRVKSLQLILEPQDGGDVRVEDRDQRIVEQYKFRENGQTWSVSEIVDEILADLLHDLGADVPPSATTYRFIANGRVVAEPFRGLLREVVKIGPTADPLSALDNRHQRYRYKRNWITAHV